MRKVAAVGTLLTYLALLGYLVWLYAHAPASVPLQWDTSEPPFKYESRETLFKLAAVGPILPAATILLFCRRRPVVAWTACGVVLVDLLLVHAVAQVILPQPFLPQVAVPLRIAVAVGCGACFLYILLVAWAIRTKQDVAP